MNGFALDIPTRVEFGENIFREALPRIPELRGKRVLVVSSGRSLHRLGYLAEVREALDAVGESVLYDAVSANPRLEEVAEAVALGRAERVEAVLGFGGGSSIDAAKLTAACLGSGQSPEALFEGGVSAETPRLPLAAVPTTAGSGSEVSPSAILSGGGVKRSIRGRCLYPDAAVVDPCFTRSVPWRVTAETGFDVFAHAVETLVSVKASPYSEMLSMEAVKRVAALLPVLKADPGNAGARAGMSFASLIAGFNLTLAGTLLPHRLQYPVGARAGNSHGAGLMTLFPAWLEEEYPHRREKLDAVAALTGFGTGVSAIVRWIDGLGVRQSLTELGFAPEDAGTLADAVSGNLDNDPAYRGRETILRMYQRAFE